MELAAAPRCGNSAVGEPFETADVPSSAAGVPLADYLLRARPSRLPLAGWRFRANPSRLALAVSKGERSCVQFHILVSVRG